MKALHHRKSIRLKGYDYSRAGAYFVTICTQNRERVFGNIVNDKMVFNDAGRMIEKWYLELNNKFPDIECDAFMCMPNHVHFIVVNTGPVPAYGIVGADLRVRPDSCAHKSHEHGTVGREEGEHRSPLRAVVQWFKTMTTNEYIRGVKQQGWPRFRGKLWQRNYWEHIVRNELELNRIRKYIVANPAKWESDRLNATGAVDTFRVREPIADYAMEGWMV